MRPFVHWLPEGLRFHCIRYFSPWAWMTKPTPETIKDTIGHAQWPTRKQMEQLFPDCEIFTERLFGIFPKPYIAVRKKS